VITPRVKPCVSANIDGCQRDNHKLSPEKNMKNAKPITNKIELAKNRKGISMGGKPLNDKPEIFTN
jgi:hypothetical protein